MDIMLYIPYISFAYFFTVKVVFVGKVSKLHSITKRRKIATVSLVKYDPDEMHSFLFIFLFPHYNLTIQKLL